MLRQNKQIRYLMSAVREEDRQYEGSIVSITDVELSSRRRKSIVDLSLELAWLVSKFEDFTPSCWW